MTRIPRVPRAVPNDLVIPIATKARVHSGMPLANLRRLVSLFTKYAGPEWTLLRVVGTPRILAFHAHRVNAPLMPSSQHCRPRGHAPGADIRGSKAHTVVRQRIDVRRIHPVKGLRIATHRAMRMIVRVDEQNIRPLLLRSARYPTKPKKNQKSYRIPSHMPESLPAHRKICQRFRPPRKSLKTGN